jgi:N6-adenosine-specific RNA methylase IME4
MSELALTGVTYSETSLELPPTLTFERWTEIGKVLGRIGRAHQWWIGDWLNYGERAYGEKYAQAMDATGLEYGTVANCAYVAGRIELSRRRESLTFAHHQELAPLELTEQDAWMERAELEALTRNDLRRELRQRHIGVAPVLPPGQFSVLYCDPPWRYEHAPTESRAVENHYPTLELDAIKELEIPAADDAVLFLWATSPKLAEAMEVIDAWGFDYRTCMVWAKDRIGMGYYARQQHELLLIARRGELPVPAETDRPASVVHAPRGKHSEKPPVFYELIERMYPNHPRVELFARVSRAGWESWGNELEVAA